MNDDSLRYPTGKFSPQPAYTTEEVEANIRRIEMVPASVEKLALTLSAQQLDTPYRDGGWTARQVIHHIADSHLNAYIRFKWTLTESTPTIKTYDEKLWAQTPETTLAPSVSIVLIKAHHVKWVSLLKTLSPSDLKKEFFHPDSKKNVPLDRLIALYAWHGEHHLGHLKIIAGNA